MTKKQLRELARLRLDAPIRNDKWLDSELDQYIDAAIDQAIIRTKAVIDSTSEECSRISVTAGNSTYPVHNAVYQIKRVFDATNNRVLTVTSAEELDGTGTQWMTITDDPTHYLTDLDHYGDDFDSNRQITLYPIPTADLTLNLTVYRTQLDPLPEMMEPEIPAIYHMDLLYWVCHLAYMKQDADTLDVDKALANEHQFELCFGLKPSLRDLMHRRKTRLMHNRASFI